jgi:XTP/dITP diphosphohydrolase
MDNETLKAFERLLEIMNELRAKCPWDKSQTMESLRKLTIEETYELADAIIEGNMDEIKKELGDLMLHIVFYAKIGEEKGAFNMKDVLDNIIKKLIYRHPHVFGQTNVADAEEVKERWEDLKLKEGNKSVLGGLPKTLPAMIKANRIQDKVRSVGFDWDKREQVFDKIEEEIAELKEEINKNNDSAIEKEFGDVLFSVINAARLYGVDPETALEKTNRKFIKRFLYLEDQTIKKGKDLRKMNLEQMDAIWEEAKKFDKD